MTLIITHMTAINKIPLRSKPKFCNGGGNNNNNNGTVDADAAEKLKNEIRCEIENDISYFVGGEKKIEVTPIVLDADVKDYASKFECDESKARLVLETEGKEKELLSLQQQCKVLKVFIVDSDANKSESSSNNVAKTEDCLYAKASTLHNLFSSIEEIIFLSTTSDVFKCTRSEFHKMCKIASKFENCKKVIFRDLNLVGTFLDNGKLDTSIDCIFLDGQFMFDQSCSFPTKETMINNVDRLAREISSIVVAREVNLDMLQNKAFFLHPLLFLSMLRLTLPYIKSLCIDVCGYNESVKFVSNTAVVLTANFYNNLRETNGNLPMFLRNLLSEFVGPLNIEILELRIDCFSAYDILLQFLVRCPFLKSLSVAVQNVKDDINGLLLGTTGNPDDAAAVDIANRSQQQTIIDNRIQFLNDVLNEKKSTLESFHWGVSLLELKDSAKLGELRKNEMACIATAGGSYLKVLTIEGEFVGSDVTSFGDIFLNKNFMKSISVLGMYFVGQVFNLSCYPYLVDNFKDMNCFPTTLYKFTILRGADLMKLNLNDREKLVAVCAHRYPKPNSYASYMKEQEAKEQDEVSDSMDVDDDDDDKVNNNNNNNNNKKKKSKEESKKRKIAESKPVENQSGATNNNNLFDDEVYERQKLFSYLVNAQIEKNYTKRITQLEDVSINLEENNNMQVDGKKMLTNIHSKKSSEYDYPLFNFGRGSEWNQ